MPGQRPADGSEGARVAGSPPALAESTLATGETDPRLPSTRDVLPPLERPRRRRLWLLVLGACALALGAVAVVRYGPKPRPPAAHFTYRPSVAILGVTNALPTPEWNWLPVAISELVGNELAEAETSLRVVSTDRSVLALKSLGVTQQQLSEEATRKRLQALLVPEFLVYGTLTPSDDDSGGTRLSLHLLEAQTGKELLTLEEELGPHAARLPEASVRMGKRLREALHVSLTPEEEAALSASRPRSSEAAQDYGQALLSFWALDFSKARSLLQAALTPDPAFLSAQRRVVRAWESQGYRKRALEAAQLIRSRPNGLTTRQKAGLDADIVRLASTGQDTQEPKLALFDATPDDVDLGVDLVWDISTELSPQTSVALVRKMRQLPPPASQDLRIDWAEAFALGRSGETERAEQLLEAAQARAQQLGARWEEAYVLWTRGLVLWIMEKNKTAALAPLLAAERLFEQVGDAWDIATFKKVIAYLSDDPNKSLKLLDETASIYRGLGNRADLAHVLLPSALISLNLGELEVARKKLEEARAILLALGEVPGQFELRLEGGLAWAEANAQGMRDTIQALKKLPLAVVVGPLGLEALLLFEQDHLREAHDTWVRFAQELERQGNRVWSVGPAQNACAVQCDEGRPADGLKCLSEHPPAEGLARAHCEYLAGELAGAERDVLQVLSEGETLREEFERRFKANLQLMRIVGARGEYARALTGLRGWLRQAEEKKLKTLAFEAALALGEVELRAGRPEGRARLAKLEKEAEAHEFFRIARLAGEALHPPSPRGKALKPSASPQH